MTRLMLQAMLQPTGATVEGVGDGSAAVATFERDPPDIVLMDIRLRGIDGVEASRRIRALGGRTPIIALTGYTHPRDDACFRAAGLDGCLAKPLRLDALYAALGAFLAADGAAA